LRLPLELVRDRPLTLGRGAQCDVLVRHDTVSRRHAEIRREGGACYVSDLGSSNGTWIDGRRVDAPQRIRRGDQILLGGCLVVVV
jgi:pSer/pThr/pTyr-binding forkhead associated (FHA) protein